MEDIQKCIDFELFFTKQFGNRMEKLDRHI